VSYDAFISYSHGADGRMAPALQSGLQRLAKPWYRVRALRVFRDESALSANPQLWTSIQRALDESEWFVLLASPQAADSQWVNRELEYWITNKSVDRLLPVVTDGTWEWVDGRLDGSAVLPVLGREIAQEPRHLDLRWAHTEADLDLHNPRFRDAVAQLAAPMHGIAKDDLESEDVRLQRRARRLARGALTTLALLTAVAVLFGAVAVRERNSAQANARDARHQATVADSQRLAVQAQTLAAGNFEVALLLAAEARNLDDSVASRGALEAVLSTGARLARVVQLGDNSTPAVSADGRLLAVADAQGHVTVRDIAHGRVLTEFSDRAQGVRALAFSRDGRTLAVSRQGGIDLRTVATGRPLARPLIWSGSVGLGIAFSPDSTQLAATDLRGNVATWKLSSARRAPRVFGRPTSTLVTAWAWSPDSRKLAVLDATGAVTLLDPATGRSLEKILIANVSCPQAMAFTPDGRTLVVGLSDGRIGLFDVSTGRQSGGSMGDAGPCVSWLAFSPDGSTLAVANGTGVVTQWDVVHRRQRGGPLIGMGANTDVAVLTADDTLITLDPQTLSVWRLGTVPPALARPLMRFGRDSAGVFMSRDGSLATMSTSHAHRWILYDLRRGRVVASHAKSDVIDYTAWSPDGTKIAMATIDGRVRLIDPTTGRTLGVLVGHHGSTTITAFSPDGRLLASGTADGTVLIWDVATRRLVGPPIQANSSLYGVAFSPDGKHLAFAGVDGNLTIDDLKTRRAIHTYDAHVYVIRVAFSPDGKTLALAGYGGTRLVDVATGRPLGEPLAGHTGPVTFVSFSGDGSTLATASLDGTIILYDVASHQPIGNPLDAGYPGGISTSPLTPDGRELPAAYGDGHIVMWDVDPASWQQRACALAGRNLTHDEWRQYLGSRPYEKTCQQWPSGP
jgi:WD40 repeat protein